MDNQQKKKVVLGITFLFILISVVVIAHIHLLKTDETQTDYEVDMSNVRYEMKKHIYNGEDYTIIQPNKYMEEKNDPELRNLMFELNRDHPPHTSKLIYLVNKDETTLVRGYKNSVGVYIIEYYENLPDNIPQYLSAYETKK